MRVKTGVHRGEAGIVAANISVTSHDRKCRANERMVRVHAVGSRSIRAKSAAQRFEFGLDLGQIARRLGSMD